MKKYEKMGKRSQLFWYSAVVLSAAFCGSVFYTLAFMTDSGILVNRITAGHNTTTIEETFPPQTAEPGKDTLIEKKVCIQNEKNEANAACYVRARIGYNSSDFGDYSIWGMDGEWMEAQDGYYYYSGMLMPGEKTKPLMTGLKISGKDGKGKIPLKELEIQIYEESCQAVNPETLKYWTYKEAWAQALGREVKIIET